MNPPFTKVERGIAKLVDMKRFAARCGNEVGLWGHFIAFAEEFLKKGGTFGGVIPINILRGRESHEVREQLFNEWTPLYIVKTTFNYAFSEWSEYRDILIIARREKPKAKHKVKFCLVKKDLLKADHNDITMIAESIIGKSKMRSPLVDIDSHPLEDVRSRFSNMMWYCGIIDFKHRDAIIDFVNRFPKTLGEFPAGYFKEGFRAAPKGISHILFLTRELNDARVQEAFLRFKNEEKNSIIATAPLGAEFEISLSHLRPSLRTPTGLTTMNIDGKTDYIATAPYSQLDQVRRATKFRAPSGFKWGSYWASLDSELLTKEAKLVISRRINPFSPATCLIAFYSSSPISPADQLKTVRDPNDERLKAVCTLLNSILYVSQFFLLKEESTGRYIDIRSHDLAPVRLYPDQPTSIKLAKVHATFGRYEFSSLRQQFDRNFELRYKEFWDREKSEGYQRNIWSVIDSPVEPTDVRLEFDMAVCDALRIKVTREDLLILYEGIVKEMIMTRHLTRD